MLAVLAGAMLVGLWFLGPGTPAVAVAPPIASRSILLASHPVASGALLRLGDMTWGDVPANQVDAADIAAGSALPASFVGAVTRHAFAAREPLTLSALVRPGDKDFLVAALGVGFRAVSISVDATQSTAGLMSPGDRVDVILTQTFPAAGIDTGRRSVGETVLRDLRVIAVDQTLSAPDRPAGAPTAVVGEVKMPKTVTLEVTETQAATLLVAEQLGKIALALRGQEAPDTPVALLPVVGLPVVAPPVVAPPVVALPVWASDVSQALGRSAPPEPARGGVQVIHGARTEHLCPTSNGLVTCP